MRAITKVNALVASLVNHPVVEHLFIMRRQHDPPESRMIQADHTGGVLAIARKQKDMMATGEALVIAAGKDAAAR